MRLPRKVRRTTWCLPPFGSSAPLDEDDESRATIIEVSHPRASSRGYGLTHFLAKRSANGLIAACVLWSGRWSLWS